MLHILFHLFNSLIKFESKQTMLIFFLSLRVFTQQQNNEKLTWRKQLLV